MSKTNLVTFHYLQIYPSFSPVTMKGFTLKESLCFEHFRDSSSAETFIKQCSPNTSPNSHSMYKVNEGGCCVNGKLMRIYGKDNG